ncbi:unnamed protein product [Penicillium egyptiacum]|uniref:Uncharacterized protein n=1 Tax=Penicillium egyptiacum TaxID=1303716 RepID=A0A9W4P4Q4_9EURO|nr:unnamed protein product [Penicillium egyptiacum]
MDQHTTVVETCTWLFPCARPSRALGLHLLTPLTSEGSSETPKLETFIYQRGWTKRKDWVLKASDLSQALQYTSQTLTSLELSFSRSDRRIHEDLYLQPLNLTDLVNLKRLRISGGYLVQSEGKLELLEGSYWRLYDPEGAFNSSLPFHKLLPKSLEELHVFQIHDGLEFILVCDKLCQSLRSRTVPNSSEPHQFQHLNEIIIEAPSRTKMCVLI